MLGPKMIPNRYHEENYQIIQELTQMGDGMNLNEDPNHQDACYTQDITQHNLQFVMIEVITCFKD